MADTVQGGNDGSTPPKEMSMETRLLLAFLLMGVVMFLTPYFFKSQPPPRKESAPAGQTAAAPDTTAPSKAPETAQAQAEAAAASPSTPATPAQVAPPFVVDNGVYKITFTNQGGAVKSWLLMDKRYHGNDGKPLDLVNPNAPERPFSLYFPSQKPTVDANWSWYQQTAEPDGLGVTYEYSDGRTNIRKIFKFQKGSYLSEVTTDVTLDGQPLPHMITWRGGFGDLTVSNPGASQQTLYFNPADNKLVKQNARAAQKAGQPLSSGGAFSFAGIEDSYFGAVFLPRGDAPIQQLTFGDSVPPPADKTPVAFAGVGVSDGATNHFDLFVGPKDVDLLKRVNPKLEQAVDFGWFSILAKPLFQMVNYFNDAFVHNFGWAIVVVTIIINVALLPLKLTSMKSARKMQALKPQIDSINDKYKNLKLTDPRKADQQQEVMELYKKNGVNPMGGCFPMLLQLPIFFAFYKVFTVSVEMRGASWLWVGDLSQPEHLAIRILPILMVGSQFLMQKMTPQAAGVDPSQQKMMQLMPLIFGFMFYQLPSGLVLYYLTSNLVGMAQQWFFNHTDAATAAAQSVQPPPKKKNGRK